MVRLKISEVKPGILGNLRKITNSTFSRVYPNIIDFRKSGLFSGAGGKLGNAPGWDVGEHGKLLWPAEQ